MQDVLGRLVSTHVAPPLKAAGLRKSGRRTWYLRDPGGGWVLLELQVDKWATRTELELTVNTVVWPPGTWAWDCQDVPAESYDAALGQVPHTGANAPFHLRPDDVAAQYGPRDHWWRLDLATDSDALGAELASYLLEAALPAGRALLDVEAALAALTGGHRGAYWCAGIAVHGAPDHPRRRQLLEAYVEAWRWDPRPVTAAPRIAQLIEDNGLPPRELPSWYSPVLIPHAVEREGGDPVASWRASNPVVLVTLSDGTQQQGLPLAGLGPMGLRAEVLGPAGVTPPIRRSDQPVPPPAYRGGGLRRLFRRG